MRIVLVEPEDRATGTAVVLTKEEADRLKEETPDEQEAE